MSVDILKAELDLWWKKVEAADCEKEILEYLEKDYCLIDEDRARDLAREGNL